MKLNPGDRVQVKHRKEVKGTVKFTDENGIFIVLDDPAQANMDGKTISVSEGYVSEAEADKIFELIEESDWASIWDKGST